MTKYIYQLHQHCGLIVGLFLLSMSLSGSLLVFTDELKSAREEKWIKTDNANGHCGYDASFQNIRRQYPEWEALTYEQLHKNEAVVY